MSRTAVKIMLVVFLAPSWSLGQSIPDEKESDIRRLLELVEFEGQLDGQVAELAISISDVMRLAAPGDEQRFEPVLAEFMDTFEARIMESLPEEIVRIYDSFFTHEEILFLIEFWSSEAGQRSVQVTPRIFREAVSAGDRLARNLVPEIFAELAGEYPFLEDLVPRNDDAPAAAIAEPANPSFELVPLADGAPTPVRVRAGWERNVQIYKLPNSESEREGSLTAGRRLPRNVADYGEVEVFGSVLGGLWLNVGSAGRSIGYVQALEVEELWPTGIVDYLASPEPIVATFPSSNGTETKVGQGATFLRVETTATCRMETCDRITMYSAATRNDTKTYLGYPIRGEWSMGERVPIYMIVPERFLDIPLDSLLYCIGTRFDCNPARIAAVSVDEELVAPQ